MPGREQGKIARLMCANLTLDMHLICVDELYLNLTCHRIRCRVTKPAIKPHPAAVVLRLPWIGSDVF
jgi:hypothetical protein